MSDSTRSQTYFAHAFATGELRQIDVLSYLLSLKWLILPEDVFKALHDPVFVGLDAEWFERAPNPITELGTSVLPHNLVHNPGSSHPLDDLRHMVTQHARIMEHAHMINGKLCQAYPENFQFGQTRFVTMPQGRQMLPDAFQHPGRNSTFRPIIFIGHAVDNDIAAMKSHMGVDLAALGTIALTLDTQIMARELGLSLPARKISLKDLLAKFHVYEAYLHNAGNDVAQTMIAAWLLAYENALPGSTHASPLNQSSVHALKIRHQDQAQARSEWSESPGIGTFCTRCDSTAHTSLHCNEIVFCSRCAGHPRFGHGARTHKTEKCTIVERTRGGGAVVIPCESCSVSMDPKRWKHACTHVSGECFFPAPVPVLESSGSEGAESA